MFKIFYSWQSDLPSNKTRSFIRSCIDEAIDLAKDIEAIEAERDEATLNTTGSPDIVSTLFSKIEECDLFIADVSLCFTEDKEKQKRSPNPNVMFELGYAVKTLSWERVICVANTEFGDVFPFDFDHNRRVGYFLNGKNRNEEKYRIAKRIFSDICTLRNGTPRAKNGMAMHLIGMYDMEQKKVSSILVPIKIEEQESYVLHNKELLTNSLELIEEIRKIIIPETTQATSQTAESNPLKQYAYLSYETLVKSENPVRINIEEGREKISRWLGIEVNDEFFYCGDLKTRISLLSNNEELVGSEDEKNKYTKITDLLYTLSLLEIRKTYVKTFDDMLFIPLAIQNKSRIEDSNIRVVVHIVDAEIVCPDEHLICEEIDGIQGSLCRDEEENYGVGIIDELFLLPEDGNIHIEKEPYMIPDDRIKIPIMTNGLLQYSGKDENDYKQELSEYIADAYGDNYYEFSVSSLRPNESKWLSQGMLLRPKKDIIKIHYQIHSTHTSGEDNGTLELKL